MFHFPSGKGVAPAQLSGNRPTVSRKANMVRVVFLIANRQKAEDSRTCCFSQDAKMNREA
jgi:hypothetical protein